MLSKHFLNQKICKGLPPIYDKSVWNLFHILYQKQDSNKSFGMDYPLLRKSCNIIFPMICLLFIRTSINAHWENTVLTLIFMQTWFHNFRPNKTEKGFARGYPLFATILQFNISISWQARQVQIHLNTQLPNKILNQGENTQFLLTLIVKPYAYFIHTKTSNSDKVHCKDQWKFPVLILPV